MPSASVNLTVRINQETSHRAPVATVPLCPSAVAGATV